MARIISSGEFASSGETRAAEELHKLPRDWVVIANKTLPTASGRSFEIDFIVIGDHLVFAIDEKSWRGRIHGSDTIWVRDDGSSQRSPLGKIDYVAKILAGFIRGKVPPAGGDQHFVKGCVLLTATDQRPNIHDPRAATGVLLLKDVVDRLKQIDTGETASSLFAIRPRIQSALFDLSDRPKIPQRIGPYAIDETLTERNGSYVFRTTHTDTGTTRLLTMYNLTGASEAERGHALREFAALQTLRNTQAVPEVYDPFPWSEDYLIVPSAFPAGVPLSSVPKADGASAGAQEVALAAAAFRALEKVHAVGVVHRALSPDSTYVSERHGKPTISFTDFYAARHGTTTIGPRLDDLQIADPYAAPEVGLGYSYASPESDTYSLALIFLERLSGRAVKDLAQANGTVSVPIEGAIWGFLPEPVIEELADFFQRALTKGPLAPPGSSDARRLTATECAESLEAVERRLRTDEQISREQLLDGRYQVERVLGVGASARTFLVTDTVADDLFAVKQYLRPDIMRETGDARREFNILRNLISSHLPRVYDVYPPDADVHVKMEYIQGVQLSERMRDYEGEQRIERWRTLARDLCEAVKLLEDNHLLHRDIKPSNVLIRDESDEAVLIDFGAATEASIIADPAGTYRYLPPEALFSDQPPPTGDQYAIGVLLFQALTGTFPFANGDDQHRPVSVADLPAWMQSYARVLLRAVDPNPGNRYESVSAFKEALLADRSDVELTVIDAALHDQVAPWVGQLRRLYRNSASGNADNRGLDSDFARETYVSTTLDEKVLPAILNKRPRVVFLSGNPGDGKTAFLETVKVALEQRRGEKVASDASGWTWELDGHTYRSCYDASESHEGQSADMQLIAKLDGLQGDAPGRVDLTVLIAINDGRLADFTERHRSEFGWLAREVDLVRDAVTVPRPSDVWVIDLKQRAYVSLWPQGDTPSVLRRMIETFTAPEHWRICMQCTAQYVCPIRRNALMLGSTDGQKAGERLEEAVLLAHLRGQRHITMRDLRSGLAYLITGDVECRQVHQHRSEEQALPPIEYWHLAFTTGEQADTMLGEILPMDPARFPHPGLERFLFFHRAGSDAALRTDLFGGLEDLPPSDNLETWIGRVKRRLFFEGMPPDGAEPDVPRFVPERLLPYRYAVDFIEALRGERDPRTLLPLIARGISRSDGITGAALQGGLSLKVIHSAAERLTVLKQFPVQDFGLEVQRPPASSLVEALPETLLLTHKRSSAKLPITLDLFELLLRFADGLEPASPEFQPLIEDMQPFKSAAMLSNTRDLVLVESERRLHRLTQQDGKVVRLPMELAR